MITHLIGFNEYAKSFVKKVLERDPRDHRVIWIETATQHIPDEGISSAVKTSVFRPYAKTDQKGNRKLQVENLLQAIRESDHVVAHGLFAGIVIQILLDEPEVLSRSTVVVWGGDISTIFGSFNEGAAKAKSGSGRLIYRLRNAYRSVRLGLPVFQISNEKLKACEVLRKCARIACHVEGDLRIIRGIVGNRKKVVSAFYPMLVDLSRLTVAGGKGRGILLGNSATDSNRHFELLKILGEKGGNEPVYVPLAYGNKTYASDVKKEGFRLLGERFLPIDDFMPADEYALFMGQLDSVIMPQLRQQGLGTILLGMRLGKKIHVQTRSPNHEFLEVRGFKAMGLEEIGSGKTIDEKDLARNSELALELFSDDACRVGWSSVFDEAERGYDHAHATR